MKAKLDEIVVPEVPRVADLDSGCSLNTETIYQNYNEMLESKDATGYNNASMSRENISACMAPINLITEPSKSVSDYFNTQTANYNVVAYGNKGNASKNNKI
jgi:hypothetical protein